MWGKRFSFGFGRGRRDKRDLTTRFVEALNAQDYEGMQAFLVEDLLYLDSVSNAIEGRTAYVRALQRLRRIVPDLHVTIHEMQEADGKLLLRGRIVSTDPDYCIDSLWHVEFDDKQIAGIQAFRDRNAVSLPAYAAAAA